MHVVQLSLNNFKCVKETVVDAYYYCSKPEKLIKFFLNKSQISYNYLGLLWEVT